MTNKLAGRKTNNEQPKTLTLYQIVTGQRFRCEQELFEHVMTFHKDPRAAESKAELYNGEEDKLCIAKCSVDGLVVHVLGSHISQQNRSCTPMRILCL